MPIFRVEDLNAAQRAVYEAETQPQGSPAQAKKIEPKMQSVVQPDVDAIKKMLREKLAAFGGVYTVLLDQNTAIIQDPFGWRSRVAKISEYTAAVDKIMAENFPGVRYKVKDNPLEQR